MYSLLLSLQILILFSGLLTSLWAGFAVLGGESRNPVLAAFSFLAVVFVTFLLLLPTALAKNYLVTERAKEQRAAIHKVCGPHAARLFALSAQDEERAYWALSMTDMRERYQKILEGPACARTEHEHDRSGAGAHPIRPHDPMGQLPKWRERRP